MIKNNELYINYNDIVLKVQDMRKANSEEILAGNFNINEAIIIDGGEVFIYKGNLEDNAPVEGPYLYLNNETKEYEAYGDPIGTEEDCYVLNKLKSASVVSDEDKREQLFADIMNMDNKRPPKQYEKKKPEEKPKKEKVRKRLNNDRRIKRDDILNFEINSEDDLMVRAIKEKVNAANLTMEELYEVVPSQNNAYNLFYGLSTRNTMSWKIFELWCEILELDVELVIKDKK